MALCLFRLVNMYNPGTFDIDHMEQFSTAGISLFMTLPVKAITAAFNMLHGAAKKLAEEFGATVLDKDREPLTVEAIRGYVEKVREFAAQQSINLLLSHQITLVAFYVRGND